MNIIFITREPYPLGMAGSNYVRLFAENLTNRGCIVNVLITNKHNGNNDYSGKTNGVNYNLIKLNIIQYFLGIRHIISKLGTLKNTNNKNVIFLYNGLSITNLLFALIGKIVNYKVVVHIVEDYSKHDEKISLKRNILLKIDLLIEKLSKYILDGVIVISTFLEKKYKSYNFIEDKIVLIPISAGNLSLKHPVINKTNNFTFKYCGSFSKKNGVNILLKAFEYINQRYSNVELILAGKMNKYSNSYLDLIEEKANIKYVGRIPDDEYFSFLLDSDALLMTRIDSPYANAGFPFKLAEYLGTGNPVIATDISDVKMYLTDRIDVVLAKPSNTDSLIKAMEYVLKNSTKAQEIGNNGYKKALKYFNPDTNVQMAYKFLESI